MVKSSRVESQLLLLVLKLSSPNPFLDLIPCVLDLVPNQSLQPRPTKESTRITPSPGPVAFDAHLPTSPRSPYCSPIAAVRPCDHPTTHDSALTHPASTLGGSGVNSTQACTAELHPLGSDVAAPFHLFPEVRGDACTPNKTSAQSASVDAIVSPRKECSAHALEAHQLQE